MISDQFFLNLVSSSNSKEEPLVEILRPINPTFHNEWTIYYKWTTKAAKLRISFTDIAEIHYFRVAPQGHGLGTQIMTNLLHSLACEEIKAVILIPKNKRAASFWHKLGFHQDYCHIQHQETIYSINLPMP